MKQHIVRIALGLAILLVLLGHAVKLYQMIRKSVGCDHLRCTAAADDAAND